MGAHRNPDEFVISQVNGSTRDGLTVIELFAMAAIQGLLARASNYSSTDIGAFKEDYAALAFNIAEAMVAEYNKRYGKE